MSNHHQHADLIHAWADGAKIQYFSKKRDKWVTVNNPKWKEGKDYRIKPADVTPRIELDGYLLVGTRFNEKGEDTPYLRTVPLGYSVRAGDTVTLKVSFDE